ncbi:dynein axonemal assembly factor 3-like [Saccostrea echinata]|uniref:dynein axonemal assembly factor 3-like n=1 Tax=Saccostrea echinata TaxID=191078 RepID=UPI002A81CE74|nr:dynein axonemal assembly factor 3-like [Saccostrea echinata]
MTDGFGTITWWGFSPAVDIQDKDLLTAVNGMKISEKENDELKILLVGSGDLRHVLMTIARSYRHHHKKLHFYILENALELYARDMLFLALSLETPKRMGLQEKTEMFLELFGNLLVRKQACEYVEKMANEFIKMVTDSDYLAQKLPMLDLSQLKFKERDFLEGIFKFWRNPSVEIFDAEKHWDMRQRQYLGPRYDCRFNAYDWDYHMKLVNKEADIIHKHEYKRWRSTGIAFEPREATYDIPNKTLASGVIINQEGEKMLRRGYWGDILVGPYLAFGIQSEEKSFFKKSNNQYTKISLQVAEYNLLSLFHEIAHKEKYIPPKVEEKSDDTKDSKGGVTITEISEEEENSEETDVKETEESPSNPLGQAYECLPLEDVKITFLPLNSLPDLPKKSKYKNCFHSVYFANSLVHLLTPEVAPTFRDSATVILETARYMLELKDEQEVEFANKVVGLAKAAGCQDPGNFDAKSSNVITFKYERPSS